MERAEARSTLGLLQAIRQAVPASLDNSSTTRAAFEKYEAGLIAKANGTDAAPARRWQPSKPRTKPKP